MFSAEACLGFRISADQLLKLQFIKKKRNRKYRAGQKGRFAPSGIMDQGTCNGISEMRA
jgi:hypothetical protein